VSCPSGPRQIAAVPEPGTITTRTESTEGRLTIVWADAPDHLGLNAQEEVLVTFSDEMADRHPPTAVKTDNQATVVTFTEGVRPLTWGGPLLQAWLEAIRCALLTDAAAFGRARDAGLFM
jgi:hypothetical protein